MATNDELEKGKKLLKDQAVEAGFIDNAFKSLAATLKEMFEEVIDDLQNVDTISAKIAKSYERDITSSIKKMSGSLEKNLDIQLKINRGQNASKEITAQLEKLDTRRALTEEKINQAFKDKPDLANKALEVLKETHEIEKANLENLQQQNIDKQKSKSLFSVVGDILSDNADKLDKSGTLSGILKGNFAEVVTPARIFEVALVATVKAMAEASNLTANIAQNTGLSAQNSIQIQRNFARLAANSNEVFINSKRLNESFGKLSSETGIISSFGGDTLVSFTQLTEQLGLGAEQATQLALVSRLQGTNTKSTLENTVATVNAINKQNGVNLSSREIFNDISSASKAIVVSLGMNPQLLAQAAAEARSLGSTLGEIDQIAESLLNFESSIENELTAELLTGKQLNFEKARLLALNNDLAGVSKELADNEELFSSFANGNRITQQAIADTIGISRDQMAEMVMQQKFLTLGAQGFTAEYGEQTYQQMLQLSATKRLEESMTKLKTALVDLVTPLVPIIDAFSYVISGIANLPSKLASGGSSRSDFDYDRMASAMSNVQVNSVTNYSGFHSKSQHAMRGSYSTDVRYNKSRVA